MAARHCAGPHEDSRDEDDLSIGSEKRRALKTNEHHSGREEEGKASHSFTGRTVRTRGRKPVSEVRGVYKQGKKVG